MEAYRYKAINADGYTNALNKVDYFLSSGQNSVNADPLLLTDEDLSEMKEEDDFVESIAKPEVVETVSKESDSSSEPESSVTEEEQELEKTFNEMTE